MEPPPIVTPAVATPPPDVDEPQDIPFALSIGTGPVPVNLLTLGLTGLAGRAMFPGEVVTPYVGVGVSTGTVSAFQEGERSERDIVGLTALSIHGGIRAELVERTHSLAVPYVVAGALLANVSAREGSPGEVDTTSETIVGAMGSLGLDGFVTEHLSIGAELGVLGSYAFGSDEGGDSKNDAVVVSATTGLFVTVWL
jgi:opacity protein-like surface antigen